MQVERRTVGPGAILFVGATVEHRFEEITEDLVALVLCGNPRCTLDLIGAPKGGLVPLVVRNS